MNRMHTRTKRNKPLISNIFLISLSVKYQYIPFQLIILTSEALKNIHLNSYFTAHQMETLIPAIQSNLRMFLHECSKLFPTLSLIRNNYRYNINIFNAKE
jgi:hypothetical protein